MESLRRKILSRSLSLHLSFPVSSYHSADLPSDGLRRRDVKLTSESTEILYKAFRAAAKNPDVLKRSLDHEIDKKLHVNIGIGLITSRYTWEGGYNCYEYVWGLSLIWEYGRT